MPSLNKGMQDKDSSTFLVLFSVANRTPKKISAIFKPAYSL
jgi:hypothetical protein